VIAPPSVAPFSDALKLTLTAVVPVSASEAASMLPSLLMISLPRLPSIPDAFAAEPVLASASATPADNPAPVTPN